MTALRPKNPFRGPELNQSQQLARWRYWILGLGLLHLIFRWALDPTPGIILIAAGVASLYFVTESMFVVFAVALSWAALPSLLSSNWRGIATGLFDVFIAGLILQSYWRFFQKKRGHAFAPSSVGSGMSDSDSIAKVFPLLGCALSVPGQAGLAYRFGEAQAAVAQRDF